MSDRDREAFEKWFPTGKVLLEDPFSGDAPTGFKAGWQAARDHYAPKLTEKEAVEAAEMAIAEARGKDIKLPSHVVTSEELGKVAIAALRAAGIRFKEEA